MVLKLVERGKHGDLPVVPGMALLPANISQHLLAQDVGIALPGLGEGNEFVGNGLFNVVGTVPSPESDARQFESDAQNSLSLRVETLAVEKGGYGHDTAPLLVSKRGGQMPLLRLSASKTLS
jgi:hypothetical protein